MPIGAFKLNSIGRYLAPTATDYTVPTAAFTSDSLTKTLLKFENNVTDTSGSYSYTNTNGTYNTSIKQFGTYSWFSASSASLLRYVSSTANVTSPSSWNNTIEGWVYPTSYTDQEYAYGSGVPKGIGWTAANDWGMSFGITNSGYLRVFWYDGGYQAITSTTQVTLNQWNHIVFQFNKNTNGVKLGLNGYWVATGSITGAIGDNRLTIGTVRLNSPNNYWDEVRYSNAMRYASRTAKTVTPTNVTVSTTQSKFGGASAVFNPASTPGLEITSATDFTFGTSDFTVEAWIYVDSVSVLRVIWGSNSTAQSMVFYVQTNRSLNFYTPATGQVAGLSNGIALNTWTHVALSRSSGVTRGFINGSQAFSTTTAWNATGALNAWIGRDSGGSYFSGYIDEVRVSSTARYTGTFTAPTAAFTNDSNTILLTHMNGTNASTIFQDDNA